MSDDNNKYNRSSADAFRKKSGLDVTFATLMKWMHKDDDVSFVSQNGPFFVLYISNDCFLNNGI